MSTTEEAPPRSEDRRARAVVGDSLYAEVSAWLIDEAALLDTDQVDAWLELLAPDLSYTMPIRESRHRNDGDGIDHRFFHFDDNRASMEARVKRLGLGSAYAEDPPSRTRRFVTNLRITDLGGGEVAADSYLLVLRNRGDSPSFEIVSCARHDVLRRVADGFQLVRREIVVDQASLGVTNLALFF